tara:strand:+ start:703 stop:1323 length:621 start_codon:yes stop_codon:yes gene_type:complete
MMERKKKLKLIQLSLLIFGILIIYITYYNKDSDLDKEFLSKTVKDKLEKQKTETSSDQPELFREVFFTGLDLNGNRYSIKSEEAFLDEIKPEIVYMKNVHAIFYFKNSDTLDVFSDEGVYNNKSFDMKFEKNVKAKYQETDLFAEKAEYSNSKSFLVISDEVKINDIKGNLIADKLIFDIKKKKLDITSFNNGKINANVKLNEKRF